MQVWITVKAEEDHEVRLTINGQPTEYQVRSDTASVFGPFPSMDGLGLMDVDLKKHTKRDVELVFFGIAGCRIESLFLKSETGQTIDQIASSLDVSFRSGMMSCPEGTKAVGVLMRSNPMDDHSDMDIRVIYVQSDCVTVTPG
jgi:hypothetical protein